MPLARLSTASILATLLLVPSPATSEETQVTKHAHGPFDVELAPLAVENAGDDSARGRMSIDKQYHGELEATALGQMLTGMTAVQGSAGYVAIERVSGKLAGKAGTFLLQHTGTMNRGEPNLLITVVPDSGTGELTGLQGKMAIVIEAGKHFYDFEYTLPE